MNPDVLDMPNDSRRMELEERPVLMKCLKCQNEDGEGAEFC